jgi:serine/threonine-protein kinase
VPWLRRIDELCDQFEQDWLAGRRPTIETYINRAANPDRSELFCGLLAVELELRRGEQQLPHRGEYLRRLPEFHQEILNAFADERPIQEAAVEFAAAPQQVPATAAGQIVMQVIAGPLTGRKFTFEQHDTFLVGRSVRAHLQLEGDPHFSRFHFRLEVNPPRCYLLDLGSRNGTFVNGRQVHECDLQDGDIISGGTTEMKIFSTSPSADQTLLLPARAKSALAPNVPAELPPRIIPDVVQAVEPQEPPPTVMAPDVSAPITIAMPQTPAAQEPLAVPFGVNVAGYELHSEIGRGDLGTVYRALQLATRRTVALKVMTPAVTVADKALQLFVRECAVLGQLNHPHIIKLLDQGTGHGYLYVATEFIATVDLAQQLRQRPLKERIRVCGGLINQVLAALQYAHSRSLVHRDIKPGNILIAREGQRLSAKLADFGVAKHYTNAGFSQITRSGDVIGSLPYMPPEQFLNSREARPSCDLYAAGATFYQWLTGHTPHDFPPGRSQFLVVLEDAPVPIANRVPDIPPALAAFVDRALARQPEQRFVSAEEMRHALKTALKG